MPVASAHLEANRQMTICNACRYCEGLCAVFPAMERRRVFTEGSLDYLANLCHNCGACYYACQYAPPHEFAINVPKIFAELRAESYVRYTWPRLLTPLFQRNGLVVALAAAVAVAFFVYGFIANRDVSVVFIPQTAPGAFYRVMPHAIMVELFGSVFLFAIIAITMSVRAFWRATGGGPVIVADVVEAGHDAATLRYLDGSGNGCMNEDEQPNDHRRVYHHLTFYGFLSCFASTALATLLHNGLGWEAPYPWYNPVVLFGALGGVGLIIGPIGLLCEKATRDPALVNEGARGMEVGFLVMLCLTSVTGLLLLVLRATSIMNLLLAVHLGVVFALFLTLPYSKFVHGFYRYAALVRFAQEKKAPAIKTTD